MSTHYDNRNDFIEVPETDGEPEQALEGSVLDADMDRILNVLDEVSGRVHNTLYDMGIDSNHDGYVPMFTNLLALTIERYDHKKWQSSK